MVVPTQDGFTQKMWTKLETKEWYRGLSPDASFEEFQAYLYRTSPVGHSCPPPC